MKSKVYFVSVNESDPVNVVADKLRILINKSRTADFAKKGLKVAVKMHFGEQGNTGFVRPEYLRCICDYLNLRQAKPFLSDTNTLYRGRRTNSVDHLAIAAEHGFTKDNVAADIIIPDDSVAGNSADIRINRKFIKVAKIARIFRDADAIIAVSHFKGHIMTGFGGALKNLGMGCATRVGKLMQHSDVAPIIYEKNCVGCRECEKVCPVKAIRIENNKAVIDGLKCIGCASCSAACSYSAIDVYWESGGSTIQEKMIEYASAVLENKKSRMCFFNFAVKITKECDCLAKDDPRVSPDVGIFASTDPVSIDKSSFDMVNKVCNKDIFKEIHPHRNGLKQLEYAQELGLGTLDYELIEL
ncbi:MAG: DUF362 domain-containing protein [Candidatus Omnitrophica bacterium]|nr:DUF362 domain-containing protein [Candidatus Omnitrophota bacterium]